MRPSGRRSVALVTGALLTLSLAQGALATSSADASGRLTGATVLRTRGSGPFSGASTSPLLYGGGTVETTTSTTPKVYIDWWGSQWASGFSTGGYTSAQAQTYITGFYGNVGGSTWNGVDTQYCMNTTVGGSTCVSGSIAITNPTGQLANQWNDAVALPNRITQSTIATEALVLMNHFGGYDPNATYFVFTPSGHSMRGFGTQWCAWHSATTSNGNNVAYAYMPYQPDAGTSCGENFVNKTNDSYGNGYFDGFSVVGGHEYVEAQTDPHPSNGWTDSSGSENGDKCAWNAASTDITLGSHSYAVQPIWSNAKNGCATS